MSIEKILKERSNESCELCKAVDSLTVYEVPPAGDSDAEHSIYICSVCLDQIQGASLNSNHWHCLKDSMWSQTPAVQVLAWRMLNRLKSETWAQDLLDMLYLEDDVRQWAEADSGWEEDSELTPTTDNNGTPLNSGDTVTLIKDLVVKGGGFTAKRGTAVRNISLTDNPTQIEGRVNGVRIVLLTEFLKKA